jgi:hypothetical protein
MSDVSREEFEALTAQVEALKEVVRRLHEGLLYVTNHLDLEAPQSP